MFSATYLQREFLFLHSAVALTLPIPSFADYSLQAAFFLDQKPSVIPLGCLVKKWITILDHHLVGGFKHFLFSIGYEIILPN
jgi:hypothetical protein